MRFVVEPHSGAFRLTVGARLGVMRLTVERRIATSRVCLAALQVAPAEPTVRTGASVSWKIR